MKKCSYSISALLKGNWFALCSTGGDDSSSVGLDDRTPWPSSLLLLLLVSVCAETRRRKKNKRRIRNQDVDDRLLVGSASRDQPVHGLSRRRLISGRRTFPLLKYQMEKDNFALPRALSYCTAALVTPTTRGRPCGCRRQQENKQNRKNTKGQ